VIANADLAGIDALVETWRNDVSELLARRWTLVTEMAAELDKYKSLDASQLAHFRAIHDLLYERAPSC